MRTYINALFENYIAKNPHGIRPLGELCTNPSERGRVIENFELSPPLAALFDGITITRFDNGIYHIELRSEANLERSQIDAFIHSQYAILGKDLWEFNDPNRPLNWPSEIEIYVWHFDKDGAWVEEGNPNLSYSIQLIVKSGQTQYTIVEAQNVILLERIFDTHAPPH